MTFLSWRPNADDDPLLQDLHAELSDHLAELQEELGSEGESSESLRARVDQRFGDLARIVRQCRWEHRRELILLRTVNVALLVLLVVFVGALVVSLRRSQSMLATEINQLARQVATVGASRPTAPPLAVISGRAYIRDRDQPAAGARVLIYENPPNEAPHEVRALQTDGEGRFHSGDLTLGDYFVVADLVDEAGNRTSTGHRVQSEPLRLVEVGTERHVEIDLLAKSTLRVELKGAIRDTVRINGREAKIGFSFAYAGPGYRLPWSPDVPLPAGTGWPIYGSLGLNFWDTTPRGYGYQPSRFPIHFPVPPGNCQMLVTIRDRHLLLGKNLASTMVAAEFYENEVTTLGVEFPTELQDIESARGEWNPVKLNVSVRPPEGSHAPGRTTDESGPQPEVSDPSIDMAEGRSE